MVQRLPWTVDQTNNNNRNENGYRERLSQALLYTLVIPALGYRDRRIRGSRKPCSHSELKDTPWDPISKNKTNKRPLKFTGFPFLMALTFQFTTVLAFFLGHFTGFVQSSRTLCVDVCFHGFISQVIDEASVQCTASDSPSPASRCSAICPWGGWCSPQWFIHRWAVCIMVNSPHIHEFSFCQGSSFRVPVDSWVEGDD